MQKDVRGLFISLEGGDGVGKSTQFSLLAQHLRAAGHDVVAVHEPGGTHVGERVRSILLDRGSSGLTALAELLLFEAARAQLVAEVVEPALAAGKTVLCDRFADSTTVYQGIGRGLGVQTAQELNVLAADGCMPDRTVLLTLDPQAAAGRVDARGEGDRMEQAGADFHRRVHEGFLQLAQAEPQRFRVVDAAGSVQDVHARILDALDL